MAECSSHGTSMTRKRRKAKADLLSRALPSRAGGQLGPASSSSSSFAGLAFAHVDDVVDRLIFLAIQSRPMPPTHAGRALRIRLARQARRLENLSVSKLHRLLYYVQAWSLAMRGGPMFEADFQAGVFGPLAPWLSERFKDVGSLGLLGAEHLSDQFSVSALDPRHEDHLAEVFEAYARYSCFALSDMARGDLPWIQARARLEPSQASQALIDPDLMASYYRQAFDEQARAARSTPKGPSRRWDAFGRPKAF
jgi:uncharacterized phage-associated protein